MGIGKALGAFGKLSVKSLAILGVMAAIVTAGFVTYLSNSVTATANVQSPVEISVDGAQNGLLALGDVYAGDSGSTTASLKNHANGPITNAIAQVKCWEGDANGATANLNDLPLSLEATGYGALAGCNNGGYAYYESTPQTIPADYEGSTTVTATVAQNFKGPLACRLTIIDSSMKAC